MPDYHYNLGRTSAYLILWPEQIDPVNDAFIGHACRRHDLIGCSETLRLHRLARATRLLDPFLPRDAMLAQYLLSSCVRLSVCLPVRHKPVLYKNDWTNRAGFFFVRRLPNTYPILCYKKNYDISRNYGTSLWILELGFKLRTWKISPGQVIRVVNVVDGRVCWRHLYDNRRVVAVSYKSNNCNPLTPLLRFVVDLCTTCFCSLQDVGWHSALRGQSAVAKVLSSNLIGSMHEIRYDQRFSATIYSRYTTKFIPYIPQILRKKAFSVHNRDDIAAEASCCGDAGCRYRYSSNLFILFSVLLRSMFFSLTKNVDQTDGLTQPTLPSVK